MQQKPIRIADFRGKNNVSLPEMTEINEFQRVVNAYVNDQRRFRRRPGYQKVYSGNVHSVFSDGVYILFREGTELKMLNSDYSATTLQSDINGNRTMRYLAMHNRIYYSDGVATGIFEAGTVRTWGLEVPSPPLLTETVGDLPAGRYQVALTYVRNDGQESGSMGASHVDVTDGGIIVSNIPVSADPTVQWVNVYMSTTNGEVLYRAMTVANGTTSVTYRDDGKEASSPLATGHMAAPPAGQLLAWHNGRIWIAQDNIIWYTNEYAPELIDLDRNFIPLQSRVTLLAPVEGGLFIGTPQETVFILGDPTGPDTRYIRKEEHGPIEGTQVAIDGQSTGLEGLTGDAWLWTSSAGVCVGGREGQFANLTGSSVKFFDATKGTGVIQSVHDADLYVVGLQYSNIGELGMPAPGVDGAGIPGIIMEPPPAGTATNGQGG